MAKTRKPSAADIELFRRSVGPVRRIASDRARPVQRPPPARARMSAAAPRPLPPDDFSDAFERDSVAAEEALSFARPGLQHRLLQRFRNGRLPCSAELDLHGMSSAGARRELLAFLAHCSARRLRCARIIHGKGYGSAAAPVLKNRLNHWLRQHPGVLAFNSAQPRHGGTGAVYVLLRSAA